MSSRLLTTPRPIVGRPYDAAPIHQRVAAARTAGPDAVVRLIADRMVAAGEAETACTVDDLKRAGFSLAEIADHSAAAAIHAGEDLAARERAAAVAA